FTGAFFVRTASLRPLSTLLQEMLTKQDAIRESLMQASGTTQYQMLERMQLTGDSLKMATIIVVVAPIIAAYPFIQKYFAKGAMIGSVKE
ncbi:carbohydrate ABC transporter permease, partial [Paenibacillus sp. TAF58]